MTAYVAGFLFDSLNSDYPRVALVRKARPEWQAGRLNGVGGHIEPGESPTEAMVREFREEAGVEGPAWSHFATVEGPWGSVAFFRAFSTTAMNRLRTVTDETIEQHFLAEVPWDECLPNLSWLIPLARYTHDTYRPVMATEHYELAGS